MNPRIHTSTPEDKSLQPLSPRLEPGSRTGCLPPGGHVGNCLAMEPTWTYSIAQTMGLLRGLEADPEDNDLKAKMILAWATFAYYVDAPEIKTVVGFPPQHVDALTH